MCTLVVLGLALAPTPARASVQIGDQVSLFDSVGKPGGIFVVDDLSNATPDFETFCVELQEYISFYPAVYVVDNISTQSSLTGYNLGPMTAWAYTGYLNGSILTPAERLVEAKVNALQAVIWYGMGYSIIPEISSAVGSSIDIPLFNSLLSAYAGSGWTGLGNIRIMNLLTLDGHVAQDQLVEVPVPEPMSVVVWSMITTCMGSVSWFSSRRGG
jgi:hypothetical protein